MARMGQIGKQAQRFGARHQQRHQIRKANNSQESLVYAKRQTTPAISEVSDSTPPPTPTMQGVIERVVDGPSVSRTTAPDTQNNGSGSDSDGTGELTPEKIADLVYEKLLEDTRLTKMRFSSRR